MNSTDSTSFDGNIPSEQLKQQIVDQVYGSGAEVLSGHQYLAAKHGRSGCGIFVIDGVFDRDVFKCIVAEARAAGLATRRYHLFGFLSVYSGPALDFSKFDDLGLSGLDRRVFSDNRPSSLLHLIYSQSEADATKGDGYWSNELGWCAFEQATLYPAVERKHLTLPKARGQDATWIPHSQAVANKNAVLPDSTQTLDNATVQSLAQALKRGWNPHAKQYFVAKDRVGIRMPEGVHCWLTPDPRFGYRQLRPTKTPESAEARPYA